MSAARPPPTRSSAPSSSSVARSTFGSAPRASRPRSSSPCCGGSAATSSRAFSSDRRSPSPSRPSRRKPFQEERLTLARQPCFRRSRSGEGVTERRRVAAGYEVLDLPLDVGEQRACPMRKSSGRSQGRPSSSFIRISQASASLAVRRPPAGLNPILCPVAAS